MILYRKKTNENGHDDMFEIKANINTLKCVIHIKDPRIKIHFNENSLKDILGFKGITIQGIGEHEGQNPVNIISVNSILVHCNVIEGSYLNASPKPIIYSFFPDVPPGYKIVQNPSSIVYLPITSPTLETIRIWLTDQDRKLLNIRGETVTIRLHLKSTFYS